ncbi:PadR family transcriptional regulator [Radiobacillus deserti]|nr:PadR family transcriptional regulator [Radiobacillus deserti]
MKDNWTFQLKKGSFELAILFLLHSEPMYGYEITKRLKETEELSISGGAIYPILNRMYKKGFINFYWGESDKGPPKKYYYINELGLKTLRSRMDTYQKVYKALSSLGGDKIDS